MHYHDIRFDIQLKSLFSSFSSLAGFIDPLLRMFRNAEPDVFIIVFLFPIPFNL